MTEALLTLGDIARLAQVKRPVVSMWRQRQQTRNGVVAFPKPTATTPVERFKAAEVIDWLQRTGRGNNPEAAVDVPLVQIGQHLPTERVALLESLITLRSLTDRPLSDLDHESLVDLADECDPDDLAFFTEISGAGAELLDAAAEADALCEAAFGPAPAFDRLRHPGSFELADAGVDLMTAIVRHATVPGRTPRLVAGLESSPQLAAAILRSSPDDVEVTSLVTDPSPRWLQRNLLVRRAVAATDRTAPIVQLLAVNDLPASDLLNHVDDLQLELRPGDIGLVLGPADILVDRLPTATLDGQRDSLLRLGAVRLVVRLPAGLKPRASRQRLALWVIAPPTSPLPPADRWLFVSDLSSRPLDAVAIDQLVGDIAAALGSEAELKQHVFATARAVSLPALIAARGPLVALGTRPPRLTEGPAAHSPAEHVLATRTVLAALSAEPADRFGAVEVDVPVAADTTRRLPGQPATVDTLLDESHLRVFPGTRIVIDGLAEGTVEVITASDVHARRDRTAYSSIRVDPLDLTLRHPRARRVEAGDVVFVTSPRPAAMICREAGAVVAYPARILRVVGREVVPEVAAALINALHDRDRQWRGWRFPRADHRHSDALTEVLRAIEDERADLTTRHTQLDELTRLLTAGATLGTLALTTKPTTEGDH